MVRQAVEFFNANAGALNLLFGFVVALATVFYAILTRALVRETRFLREAQTEPHVSVRVEPSDEWINLINLIVENSGVAPAFNVKLMTETDFETPHGQLLSEFGLFKHGIRVLGPKQRITVRIANLMGKTEAIESEGGQYQFTITTAYNGALGRAYRHTFAIDFRHMIGLRQGTPPLHGMAKSLDAIKNDLHNIATGYHRVQVVVYTPEHVQREDEEAMGR